MICFKQKASIFRNKERIHKRETEKKEKRKHREKKDKNIRQIRKQLFLKTLTTQSNTDWWEKIVPKSRGSMHIGFQNSQRDQESQDVLYHKHNHVMKMCSLFICVAMHVKALITRLYCHLDFLSSPFPM